MVQKLGGNFPTTAKDLLQIPGACVLGAGRRLGRDGGFESSCTRPLALFPLRRSNARRWMDLGQAPRPPCVPACIARPTFSPPSLIRRRPVHLGRRRLDRVRRPVGRRRRERHPSGLSAQGAARGSNQAGAGERRGRPTVCDGVWTCSHLLVSMLLPVPPWGQQVHAAMASEIIDVTRPGCFNQVGGCEDSVVTWDDPNLGLASDLAA